MKAQHETQIAAILGVARAEIGDQQAADFARQVADEAVDFAIVVARPSELVAIRTYFPELTNVAVESNFSRFYCRGVIPMPRGGSYRVVATLLPATGNLEAAQAVGDLIRDWNPRFVVVNGLAGGLSRDTQNFGDIVASDSIVYFEPEQMSSADLEHSNRVFVADPTLLNGLLNVTDTTWRMRLPNRPDGQQRNALSPAIHVGTIASGENLISVAHVSDRLRASHRNPIAVERESAGVASAAFGAVKKVEFRSCPLKWCRSCGSIALSGGFGRDVRVPSRPT
jgi:nucleoside phosphorylase